MKKIFTFAALLAMASSAFAQMAMTFTGIDGVSTKNLSSGCTLIELPVGTDMTNVMARASFTVDGTSVDASQIVPNPSTLSLTDGKEVTFLYKGKAYGFKFSEGKYFTAVFLSDPHTAQTDHDGTSVANMQTYVSRIVAMGKSGGAIFSFDALPGYVPSCDIAFSTGDMDADSKTDDNDFNTAHAGFATAGIPFVTMCGNHDLVPDYWTGDDGDKGLTYGGGLPANNAALATVESYRNALSNYGISDVETITDGTSHTQFNPFSFTFNGVRFYVGQTYWFQKPYKKPATILSSATYYAPDGVISALETFVGKHTGEASVWMQHYPFVAGSDCDRWWLDQSDVGRYIKTSDTSDYGTSDDVAKYTETTAQAVAKTKKDKLAEIINKTQNPVHFSGHTHTFSVYEYNGIKDYTTAASGYTAGAAYIVLMKAGKGVVEVKQVQFNSEVMTGVTDTEQTIYPTDANAVAVNLQTALKAQGVDISTATSALEAASDQSSVSNAVSAMASAFDSYINNKDNVDVTAMLGTNTGFETAQGTADASLTNVYPQTGWNEYVESFSNSGNAQYIKLQQSTDLKASGSNSLYLRAKWQDRKGKVQVMKQTALPAGVYELGYQGASVGTLTSNLNYVEVGGKRTQLPMPTSSTPVELVAKGVTLTLDEPSVVTLSFGFTGGQGGTESAVYVDDITLTYKGTLTPGTDMTSYISNATFTGGTETKTTQGGGGQVVVPAEWTFQYNYSGWNDTFVSDGVFNAWAGTISRAELSQTLSLPNGAYRLTADVKTDKEAESSTLSIYGAASNNLIGRSEEIGNGNGDFNTYSCAFDVTDCTVTIGIRSDNAYYQVKNFKLTYLGETAEAETDASYLRQDYYWNGRNSLEFDASGDKYKNATGVVIYPAEKNQIIKSASTSQFANTDNKIVDGVCQRLVIADKNPFTTSSDFTATEAVFDRSFSKGVYSTVCLPFAPSTAKGVFYRLDRDESATLYFEEESNPQCNFPYVYIAKEDGQIEASNVKVEATPSTMESSHTSAGYYMQGVYEKTSVSDIYGFNTKGELLTASTANMTPFRAFIKSSDTTITTVMANFRNSSTGIEGVTENADSQCDVYATNGELLRSGVNASSALDGLEQGIYIVKQETKANKVLKK